MRLCRPGARDKTTQKTPPHGGPDNNDNKPVKLKIVTNFLKKHSIVTNYLDVLINNFLTDY